MLDDSEKFFVQLLANRARNFEEAAKVRGEVFHNTRAPHRVASGYGVRLRHVGSSHLVEVYAKRDHTLVLEEARELASKLLEQPAQLMAQDTDHLEFAPEAHAK